MAGKLYTRIRNNTPTGMRQQVRISDFSLAHRTDSPTLDLARPYRLAVSHGAQFSTGPNTFPPSYPHSGPGNFPVFAWLAR